MEHTFFVAMIWIGLALVASIVSMRTAISVALVEICVGVIGGNFLPLRRQKRGAYGQSVGDYDIFV